MNETRLNINAYQSARSRKATDVVKVADDYHLTIKRFDPETGEPAKPEVHAVTREHATDLRNIAKRYTEIADMLDADMDAADARTK